MNKYVLIWISYEHIVNNTLDVYIRLINKILKLNCHFKNIIIVTQVVTKIAKPNHDTRLIYDCVITDISRITDPVVGSSYHWLNINHWSYTHKRSHTFKQFSGNEISKIILKYVNIGHKSLSMSVALGQINWEFAIIEDNLSKKS